MKYWVSFLFIICITHIKNICSQTTDNEESIFLQNQLSKCQSHRSELEKRLIYEEENCKSIIKQYEARIKDQNCEENLPKYGQTKIQPLQSDEDAILNCEVPKDGYSWWRRWKWIHEQKIAFYAGMNSNLSSKLSAIAASLNNYERELKDCRRNVPINRNNPQGNYVTASSGLLDTTSFLSFFITELLRDGICCFVLEKAMSNPNTTMLWIAYTTDNLSKLFRDIFIILYIFPAFFYQPLNLLSSFPHFEWFLANYISSAHLGIFLAVFIIKVNERTSSTVSPIFKSWQFAKMSFLKDVCLLLFYLFSNQWMWLFCIVSYLRCLDFCKSLTDVFQIRPTYVAYHKVETIYHFCFIFYLLILSWNLLFQVPLSFFLLFLIYTTSEIVESQPFFKRFISELK